MDWIANTEIGLDSNNSVIKRLWRSYIYQYVTTLCHDRATTSLVLSNTNELMCLAHGHKPALEGFEPRTPMISAASWENQQSAQAKTKTQISFAVTAKLIITFVFTTRIVQILFYLNQKFQASSSFLCLYRFVPDLYGNHIVGFPTRRLIWNLTLYHQATALSIIFMSRIMRKSTICKCENKDADQLRGNREADQRLCFHYLDTTISLLPKS